MDNPSLDVLRERLDRRDHGPREPGPAADDHFEVWTGLLWQHWPEEYAGPAPAEFPTLCLAGSPGKVAVLAERAQRGQGLWHPGDCPDLINQAVQVGNGRNGRVFRRGLENLMARMRQLGRAA